MNLRKCLILMGTLILVVGLLASGCSSPTTTSAPTTTQAPAPTTTTQAPAPTTTTQAPAPTTTQAPAPTTSTAPAPAAPKEIVFGQAISLSGPMAVTAGMLDAGGMKVWLQEVNAQGGLFIKQYNKRIPVRLIQYDDKSDINTMIQLAKKLITQDKVDFMVGPWGSDMNYAAAPILNQYKYPYVAMSLKVASADLPKMKDLPYRFVLAPDSTTEDTPLVNLMAEVGVKTVAVIYVQDLMGTEYLAPFEGLCNKAGIKVVYSKSYPMGVSDLSPVIKQIQDANPDAFVAFSYPPDSVLMTKQAKVVSFNPKLFFVGIGGAMPFYRDAIGASVLEGTTTWGGWRASFTPHTQDFFNKWKAVNGSEVDAYSGPWAYAIYEILGMAIEKAGTLDREAVKQVLETETFTGTVMGADVKFNNWTNTNLASYVGQWQKGVLESMWPKNIRQAQPIYPKPNWP